MKGIKDFENMTQKNIQMFEQAIRMFTPFGGTDAPTNARAGANPKTPPSDNGPRDEEIAELKDQLAAMREQIATTSRFDPGDPIGRHVALDQLPRPLTGEPLYMQIGNELNNGVSDPSADREPLPASPPHANS